VFVLDASVVISWFFQDEASGEKELSLLEKLKRGWAVVPGIWPLEVSNVLLVALRRGRVEPSGVYRVMELLSRLPIEVEDISLDLAFKAIYPVAREYELSIYDASYLELAVRKGLPLATKDAALKKAARRANIQLLV